MKEKLEENTTTANISIMNVPLGKDGKKLIGADLKKKMNVFKDFYKPLED